MTVLPSEERQRAFFVYGLGYDVAVSLAEIRLESVSFDQIFAVLFYVVDHDKLVGIADQHFPLLIYNQILDDVVACVDRVGCLLTDCLMEYFLQLPLKYDLVGDASAATSTACEIQVLSEYGYLC